MSGIYMVVTDTEYFNPPPVSFLQGLVLCKSLNVLGDAELMDKTSSYLSGDLHT